MVRSSPSTVASMADVDLLPDVTALPPPTPVAVEPEDGLVLRGVGSEDMLVDVADNVAAMTESLAATDMRDHLAKLLVRVSTERPPRLHGPVTFSRSSPVGGTENPFGVDIAFRMVDNDLVGETILRSGSRVHPGGDAVGSFQG